MDEVGRKDPQAIAIVEAALILEAGATQRFDCLVVVTCQPEQRIQRWAVAFGVDEETARREVDRRMAAQLPDSEKIKAAQYVIDNSGSLDETRKQVAKVYADTQTRNRGNTDQQNPKIESSCRKSVRQVLFRQLCSAAVGQRKFITIEISSSWKGSEL